MARLFLFLSLFILISCGNSADQKVENSIDRAQTYLSSGKCDDALKALEGARDMDNAVYVQVLASVYACKADVEIVDVITELENFNVNKVFSELSKKKFALTNDITNINHMKNSLNVILSTTDIVSQSERDLKFGKRKGQDLGMQLLFYSLIQASKFTNYFGNAEDGKKGEKGGTNLCFLNYITDVGLLFSANPIYTVPATNACQGIGDGHPDLDITTTSGRTNACQGVIAINNVLDTLEQIEFGDSEQLKILKNISEKIAQLKSVLINIDGSLVDIFEVRDTKSCLELEDRELELFIFAFYEMGFE